MKKKHNDPLNSELAVIDDLQITPLSDDELSSVAGGVTNETTVASCTCCVAGATNIVPKLVND